MPKPKPKGRRSACTTAPPKPQVPPPPPAPATNFIDITSSPDLSGNGISKKAKGSPPSPLDLDGIEMFTPRQKRRLDDECCILTADPLAAADVVPTATAAANDDIAVVAERGKVACRDYPHPRSACAEYPFSKTPHEKHCDKCFCYVCDVAAPCLSWKEQGHCHASDKENKWKIQRQEIKCRIRQKI
ncbi:hypothetical protein GUJ93_ZPchr0010g10049 [Zizania palustris]|uniref:Uncharacterized protein n=1 Tax=Zizania palustris TaxID=103762 RepID=A0A8J5W7B1_ZIZPA|nr:hypothetical protein GUJ93_ZPchr0010g10049 [Zizania palustris]